MVLRRLRRIGDRPTIVRRPRRRGITTTIRLRRLAMPRRPVEVADPRTDNFANNQKSSRVSRGWIFGWVCTAGCLPNGIKPVANIGFR